MIIPMSESMITFTDKKKREVIKAIKNLENTSTEFERVGGPNSQLHIGVTSTTSQIGKKALANEDELQRFLTIKHRNNDYITFAYPSDMDLSTLIS